MSSLYSSNSAMLALTRSATVCVMVVAWVTVQIELRQARSPCHSCYLDIYLVSCPEIVTINFIVTISGHEIKTS